MPISILMPALSPTMTEGNLVKWHKKEGDSIKAGDLLAEIETDKATMEVEAVDEGILGKILIPEGTESVKVNEIIGLILEEGEDASALVGFKAPETLKPQQPEELVSASHLSHQKEEVLLSSSNNPSQERIFATPLAKRIASHKGIDISEVKGTGPRGRVIKADVESFTPSKSSEKALVSKGGYTDISLNNMRKTIAKRLSEAKQTIPHFYLTIDCEIDALLALRQQINGLPHAATKLSVNDFIIKACALALKEVPEANATWHDTFVRLYDDADVAVAVAIDGGLVTPIIRCAQDKSIANLSIEMKELAEKARNGKLKPEEYQGGGFTLSNLGMFGIKHFGAIINPPQSCILAVGAGEKRPVVKNDQLTVATVMTCTLSVDHRAVDGAVGARFLAAFKEKIENPLLLLM